MTGWYLRQYPVVIYCFFNVTASHQWTLAIDRIPVNFILRLQFLAKVVLMQEALSLFAQHQQMKCLLRFRLGCEEYFLRNRPLCNSLGRHTRLGLSPKITLRRGLQVICRSPLGFGTRIRWVHKSDSALSPFMHFKRALPPPGIHGIAGLPLGREVNGKLYFVHYLLI